MKKLLSALFLSFSLAILPNSSQAVDMSASIGVGAMEGGYYGYGTERNGSNGATAVNAHSSDGGSTSEGGAFTDSTPVVFAELNLGDNMSVGVEFAVDDIETPTNTNAQVDGGSSKTNTAQASFSDLTTVYIQGRLIGGLYSKIMYHNVNVVTNESLGTGGTYPDREIEGLGLGLGWQQDFDDMGLFVRAEVSASAYESVKAVNSTDASKEITVTDLYGAQATIKIGKSF